MVFIFGWDLISFYIKKFIVDVRFVLIWKICLIMLSLFIVVVIYSYK